MAEQSLVVLLLLLRLVRLTERAVAVVGTARVTSWLMYGRRASPSANASATKLRMRCMWIQNAPLRATMREVNSTVENATIATFIAAMACLSRIAP